MEELDRDFFLGRITEGELREKLKSEAERPLDARMLDDFYTEIEDRLEGYSGLIQNAISLKREIERGEQAGDDDERECSECVREMSRKVAFKEQLEKILRF